MNSDLAKLLLRVAGGALMLPHGYAKLLKLIEQGTEASFADPLGIGSFPSLLLVIFSEFVCSMLVILGWKTRLASIPLIITMLVAAFITHLNDPFAKMELPLLYVSVYGAIAFLGAGSFSIDRR